MLGGEKSHSRNASIWILTSLTLIPFSRGQLQPSRGQSMFNTTTLCKEWTKNLDSPERKSQGCATIIKTSSLINIRKMKNSKNQVTISLNSTRMLLISLVSHNKIHPNEIQHYFQPGNIILIWVLEIGISKLLNIQWKNSQGGYTTSLVCATWFRTTSFFLIKKKSFWSKRSS